MKQDIITLRVSTEKQDELNQLNDCEALAKTLNLDYEVVRDKGSAWKDADREGFDKIKKAIEQGQVRNLVCWDLDRLYRNRKKLIAFFELCKIKGCKIYSFRQKWLQDLNQIPAPFDEIVSSLMLQIMGWLAEDESKKKSDRVKIAVRKDEGITKSYKGNKWGRKALPQSVIAEVLRLNQEGLSLREIKSQVFYWDRNNNKKYLSVGSVHKIIANKSNTEPIVSEGVQDLNN